MDSVHALGTYLFTSADAPVHFIDESPTDHLEQDKASARVKNLLIGRAIAFILHICMGTGALPVDTDAKDIRCINLSKARAIFRSERSQLVHGFVFGSRGFSHWLR